MGDMSRWRALIHLTSVVVVVLVAGCTDSNPDRTMSACKQREATGYPSMEAIANATLRTVDYSLKRVGACEDTGLPATVLYAHVDQWPKRQVANKFFKRQGWVHQDGGLVSPDGRYMVNNITSKDANATTSFVTVQFFEAKES